MAQPKKPNPKDLIKKRLKKQVDATEDKAALLRGEKDKVGKFKTNNNVVVKGGSKEQQADLDKFFKNAEEGFTDLKEVKTQDKKPYDGLLGKVEIERVVKTINK